MVGCAAREFWFMPFFLGVNKIRVFEPSIDAGLWKMKGELWVPGYQNMFHVIMVVM